MDPKNKDQETQKPEDNKDDLKKSVDESIQKMNDLVKSKGSETDVKELMKNPAMRKKMKKAMKEYEDSDEEEDDDEEMDAKKSLDSVIEANEELIDAAPVLKSFIGIIDSAISEITELRKSINDIKDSQEEANEIQKSFCEVIKGTSDLVKSMEENFETVGNQPKQRKGVLNKSEIQTQERFEKSGDGERNVPINLHPYKGLMLKSAQEGKLESGLLGKVELAGFDIRRLQERDQKQVLDFLTTTKEVQ